MADEKTQVQPPQGLEPPIVLGRGNEQSEFWRGRTTFCRKDKEVLGEARVFLDLMPVPEFRFEFTPETQHSLRAIVQDSPLGDGVLNCGHPVGAVTCHVTQAGSQYSGYVKEQEADGGEAIYRIATFLVLNGPIVVGEEITRGQTYFCGRMSAHIDGVEIIVDRISSKKQPRRNIFEATHVARCVFPNPVSISHIEQWSTNLFRSLSLMRCRWVGFLGPWLQLKEDDIASFRTRVTKTTRNGDAASWCSESMRGCFSELAPAVSSAFANKSRADALQTAFHWLIESEQCAGGVEGAIILQQAALECLAWLEIVLERRISSESGFSSLPASDKIRWLLSLHKIQSEIPEKSVRIKSYAVAFNHGDLVDVLVDVRNSLVHANPKKVARLFGRPQGDEELGELWHQVGGILQQALLASIGYCGQIRRRDVDSSNSWEAVSPAPWAGSK
jgi:hypothetical protein